MSKKKLSTRLTTQHKHSQGVQSIFGNHANQHDIAVQNVSMSVYAQLENQYPNYIFQYVTSISKKEINQALSKIDPALGGTLFVENSSIKPDGGVIRVLDQNGYWRIVLVSEAKYQGKDIENIKIGQKVGKKNNQDLMLAGNAIERAHKNISEIANLMLSEIHFPYVLFLEGSNFLTQDLDIQGKMEMLKFNLIQDH
jgi:type II restriction enzyme